MINYKVTIAQLILFLFLGINCFSQEEASIIKVGDKLPDFILQGITNSISSNDLSGKVVMINFFATWCPPCRKELPFVEDSIWSKYKGSKEFELLIVGREHSVNEVNEFKKGKFTMPFYADADRKVYSLFAENTIPRNYVINKKGEVIYASSGYDKDEFNKLLNVLKRELKK